jgi:hypothetical protein
VLTNPPGVASFPTRGSYSIRWLNSGSMAEMVRPECVRRLQSERMKLT